MLTLPAHLAAALSVIDWRDKLPRNNPRNPEIGREAEKTSITLHYNGPPVHPANQQGAGLLRQLLADCKHQMRPGGLGSVSGGDGLQYHFVVSADGKVYQTRNLNAILWHCAHFEGNRYSVAVHLPIGQDKDPGGFTQDATPIQWEMTCALFDALIEAFSMESRRVVYGHREWSPNDCPGRKLFPRLLTWRAAETPDRMLVAPPPPGDYVTTTHNPWVHINPALGDDNLAVDAKTGGPYRFPLGAYFPVSSFVPGDAYQGNSWWAHHAAGIGFVHASQLKLKGS